MINQDQFGSAVRWLLTVGGTALASKGIVSDSTIAMIVGGCAPAIAFVWSMAKHTAPKIFTGE